MNATRVIRYLKPLSGLLFIGVLSAAPPPQGPPKVQWASVSALAPAERVRYLGEISSTNPGIPNLPETHLLLGKAYMEMGASDRAIEQFEHQSLPASTAWEYPCYWRGKLLAAKGDKASASKAWQRLFLAGKEGSFTSEAARLLSAEAEERGSWEEAAVFLHELWASAPRDTSVMSRLVEAQLGAKNREAALGVARTLWTSFPSDKKSIELFKKHPDIEKAAALPGRPEALQRLKALDSARAWWRLGKEAGELKMPPGTDPMWREYFQARIFEGEERWKKAEVSYESAAKGTAEVSREALLGMGRILPSLKLPETRARYWEDRLAATPGTTDERVADCLVRLMKWRHRTYDETRAMELASAAIAIDPSDEDALEYLYRGAWKRWMLGEPKVAEDTFRKIAGLAPQSNDYNHAANYSLLLLGMADGKEAASARTSLELASRFGYFGYRLRGGTTPAVSPRASAFENRPAPEKGSHREKGEYLSQLGLLEESESEFRMAVKDSKDKALYWDLARQEAARGDLRKSITHVRWAFPDAQTESGAKLPVEVWQALYPIAYERELKSAGSATGLPFLLLCSITRQESLFDAGAVSRSNALGLMQLLPSTGRMTAKKHGLAMPSSASFKDPSWNSRVGAAFFSDVLKKFGGRVDMALASYNAGPNRVSEWNRRPGCPDTQEAFIESIPFKETRSYVRRILLNYWEYNRLYPSHSAKVTGTLAESLRADGKRAS